MKKNYLMIAFLLIGTSLSIAQPVVFQAQVDKKTATNGGANHYFGTAVAIDSSTIMIGAIGFDNYKGGVYVFTKSDSGWHQTQFLTDPYAVAGEFFGNAISINENTAAIGGCGRQVFFIYQNVGGYWTYKSTFYLEEPHYWFGQSVYVNHDNSILIGSPADVWGGTGRVYLYTFNAGWGIAKIFYSPNNRRTFGSSVCFIPDTVPSYLIGDYFISNGSMSGVGEVYLNVRTGSAWTEYTFTPSDPTPGCNYGWAIAAPNSSTIIISAYNHSVDTIYAQGAVYVYKYNPSVGWPEIQKILPPEPVIGAQFGSAISANGDKLLVGAFYENNHKGAAYLYKWQVNQYVFERKIEAEDGEANDEFGVSVGVYKNNYVIGAHNDKVNGNEYQGSAYVFSPLKLRQAFNLDLFASTIHSGTIIIDTSTISDPGALPPNMILHSNKSWIVNSQNGFDFQDGIVGADLGSLSKKSNSSNHLYWLKRTDENSPWEYIGGRVSDNYLYSTIPFNSLSQFVVVDSVDSATNVEDEKLLANDFELYQNYPNPFNPSTKIRFTIPTSPQSPPSQGGEAKLGWFVTLKVYDILGNEVATLVNEYKPSGRYEVEFNVAQESIPAIASGVYFYQLKVIDTKTSVGQVFIQTKKMVLTK